MSPAVSGGDSRRVRAVGSAEDIQTPTVPAERITVALIPRAVADLLSLQERTGLSKTDIANRAISLYEFIDAEMRAGNDLLIRDPKTGQTQIVRFL